MSIRSTTSRALGGRRPDDASSMTPARLARNRTIIEHRVMKNPVAFPPAWAIGQRLRPVSAHLPSTSTTFASCSGMHTEGIAHGPATLVHAHRLDQPRAAVGRRVDALWPGNREQEPARLHHHLPVDGQRRPAQLDQRLPAGRLPGDTPIGRAGIPASEARFATSPIRATLGRAAPPARFVAGDQRRTSPRRSPGDSELDAVIDSYELAFRMQTHAPGHSRPRQRNAGDAAALRHRRDGRPTTSAGSA